MKRKDKIAKRLLELVTIVCIFGSFIFLVGGFAVIVATLGGFGRVLYDYPIGLGFVCGYWGGAAVLWQLGMIAMDARDNYWKKHGRTGKS